MNRSRLSVLFPLFLGAPLIAQGAIDPRPPETQELLRTVAPRLSLDDPELLRVPIHTHEPDPNAGEYGWWAAGRDYKVSFHTGFELIPILGSTVPENLPWRWKTEAVTVGGVSVVECEAPAQRHEDWRYEYDFGAMVETYDVRADGVEQSFVFRERPRVAGDLVIRGRVDGPLTCADTECGHRARDFVDASGQAIVRYGEAFAVDAVGRRIEATTTIDGRDLSLTVPASWLADAVYPVTVDPLTTPIQISTAVQTLTNILDIAHDPESHEVLVVFARNASATDADVYGVLSTNDFTGQVTVYTDLMTGYSTAWNQCCFVGGADKWAIAVGRQLPNGVRTLVVYVHRRAWYTPNSGYTKIVEQNSPSITFDKYPSIGGSLHPTIGTKAMLAWEREFSSANTTLTIVVGAVVDVTTTASVPAASEFGICAITGDRERPCVNKSSETGDWAVAYQYADKQVAGWDWDVRVGIVSSAGYVYADFPLFLDNGTTHEVEPKIDGSAGRYFVTAAMSNNNGPYGSSTGDRIVAMSFDWTGVVTRAAPWHVVEQAASNSLASGLGCRSTCFDRKTASHAVVAWTRRASTPLQTVFARVGLHGIPVETIVQNDADNACLSYNQDTFSHDAAWINSPGRVSIYAAHVSYPAAACSYYGFPCGPTIGCANGDLPANLAAPYRGSALFQLKASNAGPQSSCIPVLGFGRGVLTLPGGCQLFVSPTNMIALPTTTANQAGNASVSMPIPETLGIGHLYSQWVVITTLGQLQSSNAVDLFIL